MRRRILQNTDNQRVIDGSKATPMSVVFVNKNDNSLIIVEGDKWSVESYPPSNFEPVGIVVIPGEHGVLKDGSGDVNQCGVMSLVPMNYSTPEQGGTSEQGIYWGYNSLDISGKSDGLGRYDSVSDGLQNYIGFGFIPKQGKINGIPDYDKDNYNHKLPNPYKDTNNALSNERNMNYGTIDICSDFRGIVNTKIITDQVTVSGWTTANTITNSYSSGNYPAASCCARFKTKGTKAFVDCNTEELKEGKGFWYLPAVAELGYMIPRLYDINDTISKLNTTYGVGVQLNTEYYYYTSSENDSTSAFYWYTKNGSIDSDGFKYVLNYVRAFMRL